MPLSESEFTTLAETIGTDPDRLIERIQKANAQEKLIDFMELLWVILHPATKMERGWVLEAICDHLEGVAMGHIKRLLINVPPGFSKPVWEEELVLTRRGRVPLREIVVGDYVMTHMGRYRRVTAVHVQGNLPIVEVKTWRGRTLRTAPDHPYLTAGGWKNAGDLTSADVLAVVTATEDTGILLDSREARLLGYLVGDGSVKYDGKTFTNNDEEILADFVACGEALGFTCRRGAHATPYKTPRINMSAQKSRRLYEWLDRHQLNGKDSYTKRVPPEVMRGDLNAVRHYLGAHWSCDGHIAIRHQGKKTSHFAKLTTVSEGLAHDVQHLMARVGINTRIRRKEVRLKTKRQGETYVSFDVEATDIQQVQKVGRLPGLCSRKANVVRDTVPVRFETHLREDPIVSTKRLDTNLPCRCLTVEEDASFTIDDIAVHNSLATSVFFPAWEWGPRNMPHLQYVCAAYADFLTLRDNERCRTLIASPVYQKLWGDRVQIDPNNDARFKFMTTKRGAKVATSVEGVGTGERGHRLICDDPHNVQKADSDPMRQSAVRWFTEAWASRTNDKDSASIVIAQRVNTDDVMAKCIELNYTHLCVPMRFEEDHPHRWFGGRVLVPFDENHKDHIEGKRHFSVDDEDVRVSAAPQYGVGDPRTEDGELAFPELFPLERVEAQEEQMSANDPGYAVAGQMQQLPIPRGGGKVKENAFRFITADQLPDGKDARGWDFAGTDKDERRNPKAAFTVGTRGRLADGNLFITDRFKEKFDSDKLDEKVVAVVKSDGRGVRQSFPQDPGQAGKYQKRKMGQSLVGFTYEFTPESGDKVTRAGSVISMANNGQLVLVSAWWNRDYIKCMSKFPAARFRDDMDSTSRLLMTLIMNQGKKRQKPGAPIVFIQENPSEELVREAERMPDAPRAPERLRPRVGPVSAVASVGKPDAKKPWWA